MNVSLRSPQACTDLIQIFSRRLDVMAVCAPQKCFTCFLHRARLKLVGNCHRHNVQLFKISTSLSTAKTQHFDDRWIGVIVSVLRAPRALGQPDGITVTFDLLRQISGHILCGFIYILARARAFDDHAVDHKQQLCHTRLLHQVFAEANLARTAPPDQHGQ